MGIMKAQDAPGSHDPISSMTRSQAQGQAYFLDVMVPGLRRQGFRLPGRNSWLSGAPGSGDVLVPPLSRAIRIR